MSIDIFRDMPDLTTVRTALVRHPEFESATVLSLPVEGADGTFTVILSSGAVIRVDLTIVTPRAEAEDSAESALEHAAWREGEDDA